MVVFPLFAKAQRSNELVFDSLIFAFRKQHPQMIDSIEGFSTENIRANVEVQKQPAPNFLIEEPEVSFKRVAAKKYLRTVSTTVTYKDSTEQSFSLVLEDSIAAANLKAVRKSKYIELRGRDPRWVTNYLLPALIIGTGIAGIISLFYIRSS
jgi:hypothetical protein